MKPSPVDAAAPSSVQGLFRVWCDQKPHQLDKGRLIFFYYINYLTKYYELLDTALLVLRGKSVAAFHMYHHAWCVPGADPTCTESAVLRNAVLHSPASMGRSAAGWDVGAAVLTICCDGLFC